MSNDSIPTTIIEYSSINNISRKYRTNEEDYTSTESIAFLILTNQQTSHAISVLVGIANEHITYAFNIEVCSTLNKNKDLFFV